MKSVGQQQAVFFTQQLAPKEKENQSCSGWRSLVLHPNPISIQQNTDSTVVNFPQSKNSFTILHFKPDNFALVFFSKQKFHITKKSKQKCCFKRTSYPLFVLLCSFSDKFTFKSKGCCRLKEAIYFLSSKPCH